MRGALRSSNVFAAIADSKSRHPAYDHIDAKKNAQKRNGTQDGDPVKGAKAMYELAIIPEPPLHVVIGTDAYAAINGKIKTYGEMYPKYEKISTSTDVDK